jgi:hypothetical protein
MEIDSQGSAGEQNPSMTGNPQQPSKDEIVHKTNGIDSERTYSNGPRSQTMVGSAHYDEVKIEDLIGEPESGTEEGEPKVGSSSAPTKGKWKQPIQISPHKQTKVSIVLPHITKGVQAAPGLPRFVEKLRYVDHNVSDTSNFPECAQQV